MDVNDTPSGGSLGDRPEDLDKAAAFLQGQMNDAIWDRLGEHQKQRYRDKVVYILQLCGITWPKVR
jgi:hypothetical protein